MMPALPLIQVLLIGLLVLTNAFFATVEFALVSVRRTWLQHRAAQGDRRAEAALRLVQDLNSVVSGTQLGITMTSLGLGWVGEVTLSRMLEPVLGKAELGSALVLHSEALTLAFVLLTFLHVVLGELVPKQVALGRAERLSLVVAWPMTLFLKAVRRPLRVLHAASFFLARHLGAHASGKGPQTFSAEELKMLVTASFGSGALPAYQQEAIHNVLDLPGVLVREIMVPRPNIVSLPVDLGLEELLRTVIEDQHSRLLVYENSPEHIIGALYTKDLFRIWQEQQVAARAGRQPPPFSLRSLLREIMVVPETKPIDQLLQEFQQRRRQLALVVDEFGSTVGLVSIEDVLEQIVGEIQDEYDWEIPPGLRLGERTLVLDGRINIRDLESQFEIQLPRDKGFETLAGFVLQQFGYIPQKGESFLYEGHRFKVLEVEDHRVARVELERLEEQPQSTQRS
ncbi:MAG: HlyC/CorC family transporter [Acidobacteria bacterium]|nr:HlyC/CorC family transporter [Acidobacteriota bacterium]